MHTSVCTVRRCTDRKIYTQPSSEWKKPQTFGIVQLVRVLTTLTASCVHQKMTSQAMSPVMVAVARCGCRCHRTHGPVGQQGGWQLDIC